VLNDLSCSKSTRRCPGDHSHSPTNPFEAADAIILATARVHGLLLSTEHRLPAARSGCADSLLKIRRKQRVLKVAAVVLTAVRRGARDGTDQPQKNTRIAKKFEINQLLF